MSLRDVITRCLLFIILLGAVAEPTQAQFNVLTGVNWGSFNPVGVNASIHQYNNTKPNLTQKLDELNSWYGLSIGFRYKIEMVAINAGWIANFKKLETQNSDLASLEEYGVRNTVINFGPEIFFESTPISIGANMSYDFLKIKYTLEDEETSSLIMNEKAWNTQVYLSINIGGGGFTSLIIRPYYTFNLTDYDFSGFLNQINRIENKSKHSLNQFGISLFFVNGPSN